MAQVSIIGSGGDYTSLSSWLASADYSTDWGVGNPATALINGQISGNTTVNNGTPPNGALIKENAIAYDGTNSATCDRLVGTGIALSIRDQSIEVSGIFVRTTGSAVALFLGQFESVDANIHDLGVKTSLTNDNAHGIQTYNSGAFNGNIVNVVSEGSGGIGVWLRNSCTGTLDHITVVDAAANGSGFRDGIVAGNADNVITNSLSLLAATASGSAEAFAGTFSASSGFNASSDATATGSSPQINRTTSDLVDYAGGDFRTALVSDLSTSGSGGGFIGAFLEAGGGGGITVTSTLGLIDYTSNNATVTLSGNIEVTTTLGLISYTSNNTVVQISGAIDVPTTLGLITYTSNNASVNLSGDIVVNTTLGLINYSSNDAVVQVSGVVDVNTTLGLINYSSNSVVVNVSGDILVNATLGLINYASSNVNVGLTGEVIVNTTLGLIDYSSNNASVNLTSGVLVNSTLGLINYSSNNAEVTLQGSIDVIATLGLISYNSKPVIVRVGGGQILGTITTGYKDNIYSAGFKSSAITANYKT